MKKTIFFLAFCWMAGSLGAQDIYDLNKILEVKIYFEEANWDQKLDSLKQLGNDKRLVGTVIINGKKYPKTGVRYKGNSSYFNVRKTGSPKLPFNIKVDYKGQKQKLPGGFVTLKLSNVFRDPSFLREVLSYDIAGKYMPAPRANFAKVYVNDNYLGLYNCTESVDAKFLKKFYGEKKGALIKCDPDWHGKDKPNCPKGDKASLMYLGQDSVCYFKLYELKDNSNWTDIIRITQVLNKDIDKIEEILDVDQTLWMLAFDNLTVNLDSYIGRLCHNYYLYRDTSGIYHPVLWDMNLCFGGFRYTGIGGPLSNEKMMKMSPFLHYKEKNNKRPLIVELFKIPLYRKIYAAHLKTMLDENFVGDAYLKRANEIRDLIRKDVVADTNKLYTLEGFEKNLETTTKAGRSNIVGINELMHGRAKYLSNHHFLKQAQPVISDVNAVNFGEIVAISAKITDNENAWLYYRYGKHSNFKRIPMFDDSGHNDLEENDGIWGETLDSGKGLQYYIVAEGKATASVSPARASYEFYEVK